jgi:uridine kinase
MSPGPQGGKYLLSARCQALQFVCLHFTVNVLHAVLPVQAMKAVDVPIYDFTTHRRLAETHRVEPADVVILEGILVLQMEEIRRMLHMKIFVDTDDDVRLARRCSHPSQHTGCV